jgi:hypothetical protein
MIHAILAFALFARNLSIAGTPKGASVRRGCDEFAALCSRCRARKRCNAPPM